MTVGHLRRRGVAICAALLLVACAATVAAHRRLRAPNLPYHDSFSRGAAGEWVSYGGAWQISNGMALNRSDEFGAKLMTGSSQWTDYQLNADLKLIGHGGDVGVLVRAGNAGRGVDTYNGYYIGLRSSDSALVIGRADDGWMEGRPVAIRGGVIPGVWYRLHVVVVGCEIGAEAERIDTGQITWAAFHEPSCVAHGKIGLRSVSTGGAWKGISVLPASEADWRAIRAHAAFISEPVYPYREADYARMRDAYFAANHIVSNAMLAFAGPPPEKSDKAVRTPSISSIDSIRSITSESPAVTFRGTVTLLSPLYVQDATGGAAVKLNDPIPLNLGDEVQVEGTPVVRRFSSFVDAKNVRFLWNQAPVSPISVTATQAATGAFNSSLVELHGILLSKAQNQDGTTSLEISDSSQKFRATLSGDLWTRQYANWAPGSQMLIRGICVLTPNPELNGEAFTVLLRSAEDVELLAGPPWWTEKLMHRLLFALPFMIAFGAYVFLWFERAKMHAVLNERERLAHEMHDTLAQSFAGVGFHLQGLRNGIRSGNIGREIIMSKVDTACELVAHTHKEASASIAALHPDAYEGQDILLVFERCARAMLESDDLPVSFRQEGTVRALSLPVRDAVFQIGREAISNALRHSESSHIFVTVQYQLKNVILQVRDGGRGFEQGARTNGFGMRTMHRRARDVGAQLSIETAPGAGTLLTMTAPCRKQLTLANWARLQCVAFVRYLGRKPREAHGVHADPERANPPQF